jgi:hypothetical protein
MLGILSVSDKRYLLQQRRALSSWHNEVCINQVLVLDPPTSPPVGKILFAMDLATCHNSLKDTQGEGQPILRQ